MWGRLCPGSFVSSQKGSVDLEWRAMTISSIVIGRSDILGGGKLGEARGCGWASIFQTETMHRFTRDWKGPELAIYPWSILRQCAIEKVMQKDPAECKYSGRLGNGPNAGYTSLYTHRTINRGQETSRCSRCSNTALVQFLAGHSATQTMEKVLGGQNWKQKKN